MVAFKVTIGLQVLWFEADSYVSAVQQAIAAQVPAHCIKAGVFFSRAQLLSDSMAQELLNSL